VSDPAALDPENFPFAAIKPMEIAGKKVFALPFILCGRTGLGTAHEVRGRSCGLGRAACGPASWPFGVETYANSRRLEKSLRLQNADLLTQYNLYEADLARPKVKEADFRGKEKHLEYRARDKQPAMLCTLVMRRTRMPAALSGIPVGAMPVHGSGDRQDAGR
jgi:glycine cleavage system aminomethyltransferase T